MADRKKKVLNLYAGIGGNRRLWSDVDVTAIEYNKEIAKVYSKFFPEDKVIIADAHKYLLEHIDEDWDFIWASPPCQTHTKIRYIATKGNFNRLEKKYPKMSLYQEIILLQYYARCRWVVENVISYYEPLIKPQEVGKHYYWANFPISKIKVVDRGHDDRLDEKMKRKGFDLNGISFKTITKEQVLNNCVESEEALHIFNEAFKIKQTNILNFGGYDNGDI